MPKGKSQQTQERLYYVAYNSVLSTYFEVCVNSGIPGVLDYEAVLMAGGPNKNDSGRLIGLAVVLMSDFIADTEILARKALTRGTFETLFKRIGYDHLQNVPLREQLRLGKAFVDHGMYPLSRYMRPTRWRANDKPV